MESRRGFLWRAVELAALGPVLGCAYKGVVNNFSYAQAESLVPLEVEKGECAGVVKEFSGIVGPLAVQAERLYGVFKGEYYRSHTEPYVVPTKNGPSVRSRTVWRWEEPSFVPGHSVIEGWLGVSQGVAQKARDVQLEKLVDVSDANVIELRRESPNTWAKVGITAGLYGPVVAGLLGYEEALESAGVISDSSESAGRRNVLKLFAAGLAGVPAYLLFGRHARVSDESRQRVETGVQDIVKGVQSMSAENVFSEVFGFSRDVLRAQVNSMAVTSKDVAKKCGDFGSSGEHVRKSFLDFYVVAANVRSGLDGFFGVMEDGGIPPVFDRVLRSYWGVQKLRELNSGESAGPYTNIVVDAVVVAGVLGAVLVPAEVVIQKDKH